MTALVDTDVLIDILRETPAAQAWLTPRHFRIIPCLDMQEPYTRP